MTTPGSPLAPISLLPSGPDQGAATSPGRGVLISDRGWLPLQALSVTAEVTGADATVTVRQAFTNPTTDAIEAVYIHPLPDRAAVVSFTVTIGDRRIEGRLQERGQARAEYDQALAAGHRAAIAEEERPDVFTVRVGNLLPGDRAEVELTLVQPLPEEDGQVSFRFPLVVAPRYIPGVPLADGLTAGGGTALDTDAVPDASRITPPVLLPGVPNPVRLDLRVVFPAGVPAGLASSLHALADPGDTGADGAGREVTLQPGERLDRDVILRWPASIATVGAGEPAEPGAGTAVARVDVTPDPDGTFTFRLTPPAGTEAAQPRDVVVLLDRSGSMGGWKMAAARRAAARIVDSLGPADRFTVLAFDHTIERPRHLPEQLIEATDRNRWLAVEWLAGVEANGGTELWPALAEAFRLLASPHSLMVPPPPAPAPGTESETDSGLSPVMWYRPPAEVAAEAALAERSATCLLVTDGQVGNEDQILAELGRCLGRARVFTVGIDQAVNAGFLRRLADAGGGRCELVESEDRLDQAMGAIHRRISDAPIRSVRLEADGAELVELTPARPVDCFAGVPLVIRGRYRGDEIRALRWSAIGADGEAWGGVVVPTVAPNPAARPLWARSRIRDLEDQLARGRFGCAPTAHLEQEITELSLATGVLCRFTAFVAVDVSETVDSMSPRPVVQPVELPAGWRSGPMPAAAPMMARTVGAAPMAAGIPAPAAAPALAPESLAADLFRTWARPVPAPAGPSGPPPDAGGPVPPARRLRDRLLGARGSDGAPSANRPVPPPPTELSPPVGPGPDLGRYAERLDELIARIERGDVGPRLVRDLTELVDDLASIGAPADAVAALGRLRDAVVAGQPTADAVTAARAALVSGPAGARPDGPPVGAAPAGPMAPCPDFWR